MSESWVKLPLLFPYSTLCLSHVDCGSLCPVLLSAGLLESSMRLKPHEAQSYRKKALWVSWVSIAVTIILAIVAFSEWTLSWILRLAGSDAFYISGFCARNKDIYTNIIQRNTDACCLVLQLKDRFVNYCDTQQPDLTTVLDNKQREGQAIVVNTLLWRSTLNAKIMFHSPLNL